jgi:hypothetical protein
MKTRQRGGILASALKFAQRQSATQVCPRLECVHFAPMAAVQSILGTTQKADVVHEKL